MEEFREQINDLYYESSVKMMEEVEERERDKEKKLIDEQISKYKKMSTKRDKTQDAFKSEGPAAIPPPSIEDLVVSARIEKAGQVFKKFSSLLSKKEELLLDKLIHNDSMHIDVAVESDGKMMQELYSLFFGWTRDDEVTNVEE